MPKCMKRPPYLMFNTEPEGGGGGNTPPAPEKPTIDGETFDFPPATPLDQMTPEQREQYWRHEAKKQQKANKAYSKLGSPEDVAQKISDGEAARTAALSADEKALEDAKNAAKSAGFTEARDKFLVPAVEGQLIAATRGAGESLEDAAKRVRGALEFVDVQKFVNDEGTLDASKVETFAKNLVSGSAGDANQHQQGGDPLHQVFSAHTPPAETSGGSVASYRQKAAERFNPKQ